VSHSIQKANKALCAIKIISRYFSTKELVQLLTSNYNSEVWNISCLKEQLQHSLFNASAKALKVAMYHPCHPISYQNLHKILRRTTSSMFSTYKLALFI
jgi:hypothetical protein